MGRTLLKYLFIQNDEHLKLYKNYDDDFDYTYGFKPETSQEKVNLYNKYNFRWEHINDSQNCIESMHERLFTYEELKYFIKETIDNNKFVQAEKLCRIIQNMNDRGNNTRVLINSY